MLTYQQSKYAYILTVGVTRMRKFCTVDLAEDST
jgi:hypothetical protein